MLRIFRHFVKQILRQEVGDQRRYGSRRNLKLLRQDGTTDVPGGADLLIDLLTERKRAGLTCTTQRPAPRRVLAAEPGHGLKRSIKPH